MNRVKYAVLQMPAVYDDGNTFCFSCHNLTRADHTHHMPTNVQFKGSAQGCKNEKSVKKPANTIKFTGTETFYGSLITAAIKHFKDSKKKQTKRF